MYCILIYCCMFVDVTGSYRDSCHSCIPASTDPCCPTPHHDSTGKVCSYCVCVCSYVCVCVCVIQHIILVIIKRWFLFGFIPFNFLCLYWSIHTPFQPSLRNNFSGSVLTATYPSQSHVYTVIICVHSVLFWDNVLSRVVTQLWWTSCEVSSEYRMSLYLE